jgi:hypothetical protein
MKKFLFFILLALGALCAPVNAQQQMQALVVSSCGSVSYTAATYGFVTMDTTGKVCDSGSGGGGGTQAVNLTQILGAAVSATNPLYVAPATAANPWPVSAVSLPLPTNAAQETGGNLATIATNTATTNTNLGAPGVTACSTDTASCSLNQLLQRIAQRISSLITALGSPFQAGGSIGNTSFGATLPAAATVAAGNGVVSAPSLESAAGLTPVPSTALEANHVIKASAGNLYSFNVSADSTLSGAAWWLMIYNAASAPADGAVTPAKCYAFPSGTTGYSAAFTLPVNFSTGITMGVSTTGCFTKTASAHAFISGDAK